MSVGYPYAATAVMWEPNAGGNAANAFSDLSSLPRLVRFPDVASLAARDLGFHGDPSLLSARVIAEVDASTGLLRLTAIGSTGPAAQRTATAFAGALISYLHELKTRSIDPLIDPIEARIADLEARNARPDEIAALRAELSALQIDRASPPAIATFKEAAPEVTFIQGDFLHPKRSPWLWRLLAAALGFVGGLAIALALERIDTSIRTTEQAEEHLGAPVLAEIPPMSRRARSGIVTESDPLSQAADAFRLLNIAIAYRAGVLRMPEERSTRTEHNTDPNGIDQIMRPVSLPPKTILVTSAGPWEGKTTVAANLAAAYAEAGNRVIVISCDLRRPAVHRMFGAPERPGLTEALEASTVQRIDLRRFARLCSFGSLAVIASGGTVSRPGELLGSAHTRRFIEQLHVAADVVILDGTSVGVENDVAALLPWVDAVLLVTRAGKVSIDRAHSVAGVLDRLGARLIGVALNDVRSPSSSTRDYHPHRTPLTWHNETIEPAEMPRDRGIDVAVTSSSGSLTSS